MLRYQTSTTLLFLQRPGRSSLFGCQGLALGAPTSPSAWKPSQGVEYRLIPRQNQLKHSYKCIILEETRLYLTCQKMAACTGQGNWAQKDCYMNSAISINYPLTPTQRFTQCVQEIRQLIRKTLNLKPGHQHSFLSSFHHDIRSGSQPENLVNMHACIYFKSLRVVEPDHGLTPLTFISEGRCRITVTEKRSVECKD